VGGLHPGVYLRWEIYTLWYTLGEIYTLWYTLGGTYPGVVASQVVYTRLIASQGGVCLPMYPGGWCMPPYVHPVVPWWVGRYPSYVHPWYHGGYTSLPTMPPIPPRVYHHPAHAPRSCTSCRSVWSAAGRWSPGLKKGERPGWEASSLP